MRIDSLIARSVGKREFYVVGRGRECRLPSAHLRLCGLRGRFWPRSGFDNWKPEGFPTATKRRPELAHAWCSRSSHYRNSIDDRCTNADWRSSHCRGTGTQTARYQL